MIINYVLDICLEQYYILIYFVLGLLFNKNINYTIFLKINYHLMKKMQYVRT